MLLSLSRRALPTLLFTLATFSACGDGNTGSATPAGSSGGGGACATAPKVEKDAYCESCTVSPTAQPATCKAPRTVSACCTWVAPPKNNVARGTGLHRYSTDDATVNLGCLDTPPVAGESKVITLTGNVRLFSSGGDSKDVKIEIFEENADGSLGAAVGTPVVTTDSDEGVKIEDFLEKCPDGGCKLRKYTYANVPTEKRLIVKTSDAGAGSTWAALYDYGIYFFTSEVLTDNTINYEPSVVAATDINTVASAAGGFSPNQDKGMLAGEVHDCADIRLSGATVDIDAAHEGDMFYFGDNETNPLPDRTRSNEGTSKLGLFGTLNVTTGVPIRISAIGNYNGQTVLLGTHTVQTFKGAVTALRLRGRRPWQK